MTSGETWNYVLRDSYGGVFPPEDVMYRAVYFSPWNDSVAFVGFNVHGEGEPGSLGGQISDIHPAHWGLPWPLIGGGYIGYSPSLSFEFSPHRPNHVYSWIIDLYKSSDNGIHWQHEQSDGSYGALFMSFDLSRDSILCAGRLLYGESSHNIYRSTDDGTSWAFIRPLPTPPYPSQRTAELFANGDTLVLATNRFPSSPDTGCGISVSTDRGISWLQVLPGVNVQKMTRDEHLPNVWYAAIQGGIYRSLNGGVGWQLYTDSLPSLNLVDIRKDPFSDTLYVATSDLGVYKVFDVTVGLPDGHQQPFMAELRQNHPNPFNPRTSIAFSLSRRSHVALTVYDVLGRKIAALVEGVCESGTHQVEFQAARLASGIYLYRLKTDDFVLTRKMVLQR